MKIGAGGLQIQATQDINIVKKENQEYQKQPQQVEVNNATGVKPGRDEIIRAVEQLNDSSKLSNKHMKFQIHEETDRMMVRIMDDKGELIKEIPSEETLEMAARIQKSVGLLIDQYI